MLKIEKVDIRNFKLLKNISIELADLTLITGVNSSGKSSFIQSLLLLKQNQDLISKIESNKIISNSLKENYKESDYIKNSIKNTIKTPININGEYTQIGERKDLFHQDIYEEDIEISLKTDKLLLDYFINYKNLSLIIEPEQTFSPILNLFDDRFQYINTDRIQPKNVYSLSNSHILRNNIGNHGEYTAHYLDENRHKELDIKALRHSNSKTEFFLENVSYWLSEISGGIEILSKKYPDIQGMSLSYKYTYGENTTHEYSPFNVGFGITYVLPIIVTILKSKPNDLLIIENPESHLHPQGQSKIAELCAIASANGVQIIVETHSDHFLNSLRVATKKGLLGSVKSKIYYFEKDDLNLSAKVHELTIDKDGNINQNWPKGFFDEFRNKLDELIW
ncbi:DUF3696 domain-containing protein [Aliarcobacter lanthieri]|uniref:AAA family ATPase n=1 Tax=Aliarcobacter lanthieri TaxID=1355374 RepID=UPI003AABA334